MTNCFDFEEVFARLATEPETEMEMEMAIPDEFALHLDVCSSCRARFDKGKVELTPDAFERLPSDTKERLLNSLERRRVERRKRRKPVF